MFLKFDEVTLRFTGVTALNNVSLEIPKGGIFAAIGPNGAGKTTLLNCVSRFYTPQHGAIQFEESNLLSYTAYDVNRIGIARSFQNIELFRNLTVEENILIGLHHRVHATTLAQILQLPKARKAERQARDQAYEVMEQLGIVDHAQHVAGELAYGVQKRVDIARALVSRPKMLLLDEPAAGMNEAETGALGEWMAELPGRLGVTVVLVEHDMSLVMGISHRIAVFDFGSLIAVGTPKEISSNPLVIEAYLGKED